MNAELDYFRLSLFMHGGGWGESMPI